MAHPLIAATERATRELRLAAAAERKQEAELTAWQRYALDPFAPLADRLIKIQDKETKATITLVPFDHQRESLASWIDVEHLKATGVLRFRNVIIEKSRQQGETWIFAYGAWWAITFHSAQGLVRARVKTETDDGGQRSTARSFFGKVRFIHRNLPRDMPGRTDLRFVGGSWPAITNLSNPESFIIGEGETTESGRGGTFAFAILDEAAFIEAGELVHGSLGEACPEGRVYLSTPNGKGNVFYRLITDTPRNWRKLRVHWTQNPRCAEGLHVAGAEEASCELCAGNEAGIPWSAQEPLAHRYEGKLTSPWYEAAILDKTDEQVARELDIDYEASVAARVYTEANRELHLASEPILWQDTYHLELGFDFGLACTAIPICVDTPREYLVLGYLEARDQTPDQVAVALRARLGDVGVPEKFRTMEWTRRMLAVGDPAGSGKEVGSGRSLFSEYQRQGFALRAAAIRGARSIQPGINAVKRLLRGSPKRLVISPANGGELLLDRLIAHKWPTDRTGARLEGATVPEENADKHGCDAFRYLIVTKFPPPVEDDGSEVAGPLAKGREGGVLSPGLKQGMSL